MLHEPKCVERYCEHFLGIKNDHEEESHEYVYCKAFPKGIPNEIAYGNNKHLVPFPGQDNKIIYEKKGE